MIHKSKLLILGSGPAGLTAAIYAARSALRPILISGLEEGGQLSTTTEVENYPGFADKILGPWLISQMISQATNVGAKIISDEANYIDLSARPFHIKTVLGKEFHTEALIIATGAQAKWLGLESETFFQGFGVSGCATCDGAFFKNQVVVVVGGGNTAVEEAIFLTNHASKVYLIHRRNQLRAEQILQERLFKNQKVEIIWNSQIIDIIGKKEPIKSVTGVMISDVYSTINRTLDCSGVFIAIGHNPKTDLLSNSLQIDKEGYIVTNPDSTQTNIEGVFAAGDVQDKKFRQAVTAAGTGCMAAIEAEKFLRSEKS